MKKQISFGKKKRQDFYKNFHRAKKSAATEEKSSAAAYENDGHIFAVIPK